MSKWPSVRSGAPLGSVLGPVFKILLCNSLNDSDSGIRCIHSKSVD